MPLPTTVSLISTFDPYVFGAALTMYAAVSPLAATGTISLSALQTAGPGTGGPPVSLGSFGLAGGMAVPSIVLPNPGTWTVTATYSGDSTYSGSSTSAGQTVYAPTTTELSTSRDPSGAGDAVTFTATVSPSAATGNVEFTDGGSHLATATLSAGVATYTTSALSAGIHAIVATYGGDVAHSSSTGAALPQDVSSSAASTSTTVTASPNPATFSQSVTLTAVVSPCCIPTGTVTFFDGMTSLGSAALAYSPQAGTVQATLSTASLSVGAHSITAVYNGDTLNNSSTSAAITVTIWVLSLSVSPGGPVFTPLVFTASGIPAGVTGSIAFLDGLNVMGTNPTPSGPSSSYQTNALTRGRHTITATYTDASGGNTSDSLIQTVT